MPIVNNKNDFICALEKFVNFGTSNNIEINFENNQIVIEELEKDGKGEIYLDISSSASENNNFFIKIKHCPNHTIGSNPNHNDGIVLKVNLITKNIEVFCFKLKKQLRLNKLEKASKQLVSAYRFISYMQFEKCFSVKYKFFISYQSNNLEDDADSLKNIDSYNYKLFNSIYKKEQQIPLLVPFCSYEKFDVQQVEFGNVIVI